MAVSNIAYTTLLGDQDIRLLHLHPEAHGSLAPIRCSLVPSTLAESSEYEALSYMWGSEIDLKTLYIDGKECPVRDNLWQALHHLRLPTKTRILWVDALSINQNDNSERNHQVSQMGMIYRQAKTVLVWLGQPKLSDTTRESGFEPLQRELSAFREDRPKRRDSSLRSSMVYSRLLDVRNVCLAEYWSRLWIIQEVVLASDIKLICEWSVTVTWTFLTEYLDFLNTDERGFAKWAKDQVERPSWQVGHHFSQPVGSIENDYFAIRKALLDSVPARLCYERQLRENYSYAFNPNTSLLSLIQVYGSAKCVGMPVHSYECSKKQSGRSEMTSHSLCQD